MSRTTLDRRGFLAAAGATLVAGTTAGFARAGLRSHASARQAATAPQATPDTAFDSMFANYGNNTDPSVVRWLGADSTYSIRLPDGRTLWIFSDTFLGHVVYDSSRGVYTIPQSTPMVHNTYVVQDANSMNLSATLYGGTASSPTSLVNPTQNDGTWYWMGDATIEGSNLRQFVVRWRQTGSGNLDIAQVSTDIATFSLPSLTLQSIQPTPNGAGFAILSSSGYPVSYAAGIFEGSSYTYIYGVEDGGLNKYLHLARTPAGNVFGQWQYYQGGATPWTTDPQASARLTSGGSQLSNLANELGVTLKSGVYKLVEQNFQFGNDIELYTASNPQGPWTSQGSMYTCPEQAYYQSLGYGTNVYPYNSKSHPEFTSNGQMLLSYNVNSFNPPDVYTDASLYRPRFLRAAIG